MNHNLNEAQPHLTNFSEFMCLRRLFHNQINTLHPIFQNVYVCKSRDIVNGC